VIVKEPELGVVLCGGKIGKHGGSMCLKKANECMVVSHRKMLARFESAVTSESGCYVVVATSSMEEAVYVSLIVPVEKFEDKLETYLDDRRSMIEWESILRSIRDSNGDLEEIMASHVKVTTDAIKREVHGTVSPIKQLRADQIDAIEAAYDATSSFIAVGGEDGSKIREEQAAINDLQMQVGTVAMEVQLRTHPPKDIHQDLVRV
jgi:hypothetical protein